MWVHRLKIYPKFFNDVTSGVKKFEFRRNDRKFEVGDELILMEFIPNVNDLASGDGGSYTGKSCRCEITYMLGLSYLSSVQEYVVLGIKLL